MSNMFKINNRKIGESHPTYFIADIAANHDGSLKKQFNLLEKQKKQGLMQLSFNISMQIQL